MCLAALTRFGRCLGYNSDNIEQRSQGVTGPSQQRYVRYFAQLNSTGSGWHKPQRSAAELLSVKLVHMEKAPTMTVVVSFPTGLKEPPAPSWAFRCTSVDDHDVEALDVEQAAGGGNSTTASADCNLVRVCGVFG